MADNFHVHDMVVCIADNWNSRDLGLILRFPVKDRVYVVRQTEQLPGMPMFLRFEEFSNPTVSMGPTFLEPAFNATMFRRAKIGSLDVFKRLLVPGARIVV
jgi:hypothetical protein